MKNNLKILALLMCAQLSASSHLVKIDKSVRFASHKLGDVDLYHHNGQFMVKHNNAFHPVKPENIASPQLRNINLAALGATLEHGKIHINQNNEKEFILRAHIHGNGGGLLLGRICNVVVRGVGIAGIAGLVYVHAVHAEEAHQLYAAVDAAAQVAQVFGESAPGP